MEALVTNHRHVKINYVQQPNEESPDYYIVKMERGADGKCERTHRIRIPGHPIVGEGKPENQNMGLVWCRGQYIQTIDMNQDSQLTEGLKLRNMLSMFETSDDVMLIGFTEQLISGRQGSVSSFAAKIRDRLWYDAAALYDEASPCAYALWSPGYLGGWICAIMRRCR